MATPFPGNSAPSIAGRSNNGRSEPSRDSSRGMLQRLRDILKSGQHHGQGLGKQIDRESAGRRETRWGSRGSAGGCGDRSPSDAAARSRGAGEPAGADPGGPTAALARNRTRGADAQLQRIPTVNFQLPTSNFNFQLSCPRTLEPTRISASEPPAAHRFRRWPMACGRTSRPRTPPSARSHPRLSFGLKEARGGAKRFAAWKRRGTPQDPSQRRGALGQYQLTSPYPTAAVRSLPRTQGRHPRRPPRGRPQSRQLSGRSGRRRRQAFRSANRVAQCQCLERGDAHPLAVDGLKLQSASPITRKRSGGRFSPLVAPPPV